MPTYSYKEIKEKLFKVPGIFHLVKGRYSLPDIHMMQGQNKLQAFITHVENHLKKCKTNREGQFEALNCIIIELKKIGNSNQSTEHELQLSIDVLQGALIHRYLRLQENTAGIIGSFCSRFFNTSRQVHSELYKIIEIILGLDKVKLDDLTIAESLKIFEENMLLKCYSDDNVSEGGKSVLKPQYYKYRHYRNDCYFEQNLQILITRHQKKSCNTKHQIQAIHFVLSILKAVDSDVSTNFTFIRKWVDALIVTYADFSALNPNLLDRNFKQFIREEQLTLRNSWSSFQFSFNDFDRQSQSDYKDFMEYLFEKITDEYRFILCGVFYLLKNVENIKLDNITHSFYVDSYLIDCLEKAIFAQNTFDKKSWSICIKSLNLFLETSQEIDYSFFSSQSILKQLLLFLIDGFNQEDKPNMNETIINDFVSLEVR